MKCRCCGKNINNILIDLNFSPLANSYIKKPVNKNFFERHYPLVVYYCKKCWFVQANTINDPKDIFNNDYAYLSSTSSTFLKHCKQFTTEIIDKLKLNEKSFVLEIASNDGYLLDLFNAVNIPNLGIEPTKSTADIANKKGVKTIKKFFDLKLSKLLYKKCGKADLVVANNVYAHVPNIIDFTKGINKILKKEGVVCIEFPHFKNLLKNNLFDTIYHEHYSYLSLNSVLNVFKKCDLKIFDVKKINTQGGSLRIYGCKNNSNYIISKNVYKILNEEKKYGLLNEKIYKSYKQKILKLKINSLTFLLNQKKLGKKIAIYGAAAKGNTFLNYLRLSKDIIDVAFDSSEYKINTLMPGSLINIENPKYISKYKPNLIIILPWNLFDEITSFLSKKIYWKCELITFLPKFKNMKLN